MEKNSCSMHGYEQDTCPSFSQTSGNRDDSCGGAYEQTRQGRVLEISWERKEVCTVDSHNTTDCYTVLYFNRIYDGVDAETRKSQARFQII